MNTIRESLPWREGHQRDDRPTCWTHPSFAQHVLPSITQLVGGFNPLKNISQTGNLPQIGVNIANIWNHHSDKVLSGWVWVKPLITASSLHLLHLNVSEWWKPNTNPTHQLVFTWHPTYACRRKQNVWVYKGFLRFLEIKEESTKL